MDCDYNRIFLIQQIYATIFSLTNKLQSKGDEYCDNITVRQMMALIAILHLDDEHTTINNIASKLTTTKQSTKHIIDSLAKKEYVKIEQSITDKRAVNVKITARGKEAMLETMGNINSFFNDISSDFTIEELNSLWNLLKKIYRFDGKQMNGFEEDVGYKLFE